MITNLHSVAVFVSDRDRALRFYRDALGFEVTADVTDPNSAENRWLTLKPRSGQTNIMLLKAPPQNQSSEANQSSHIVLTSDDLETDCELIAKNGGRMLYPPKRAGWGNAMETHIADPDGNIYQLVQMGQ